MGEKLDSKSRASKEWEAKVKNIKRHFVARSYTDTVAYAIGRKLTKEEKAALNQFFNKGYPQDENYLRLLKRIFVDRLTFDKGEIITFIPKQVETKTVV